MEALVKERSVLAAVLKHSATHILAAILIAMAWVPSSHAYPPGCKPAAGGVYSCVSPVTSPYRYISLVCTPIAWFPSEAEAFAFYLAEPQMNPPNKCNLDTERRGWASAQAPASFARCGGVPS